MSDNLTIFGIDYTGVTGVKVRETNGDYLTYVRPTGTKSITENGTGIDVTAYAAVNVEVDEGLDAPRFTVEFDQSTGEPSNITCDKTYEECGNLINQGTSFAYAAMGSSTSLTNLISRSARISTSHGDAIYYIYMGGGLPSFQIIYEPNDVITFEALDFARTLSVTENGTYNANSFDYLWETVEVNVSSSTPSLQSKTATPTEQQQTVSPDSGYDGLSSVTVEAISSTYVGSGITQRTSSDLTAGGATVTVPAGYYASLAQKTIPSGTEGTPTAKKGTVSNHTITVTPSVANSAGYITGSEKTGTAVTVSASELVSGTLSITSSGTKNVTNYTYASVPNGTEGTPTADKGPVSNHSVLVTPRVTNGAGWINGNTVTGTAVTVSASELVSGSTTITENGTTDVTNLASVTVDIDFVTYHTSSTAPTSSQGSDGDIWLVTS